LRVAAPTRTLLELAAVDGAAFTRALNEVLVGRMLPPRELEAALASRRPGTARLRAALDAGPAPTRSALERRFLGLVRDAGHRTLRLTWRRLREHPIRVVADLSAALAVP
jgi:hypothetical protein